MVAFELLASPPTSFPHVHVNDPRASLIFGRPPVMLVVSDLTHAMPSRDKAVHLN